MTTAPASTPRLPAAERRELILRVAADRFGTHGYEGARLEDIAGDSGVTKPILYRHFASKKHLYLAVLARHRDDLPGFVEDLPSDLALEDLVRTILDGWLAYAHQNQLRWRMLFRDNGGDDDVQRARAEVHDRARDVLASFLAAHPGFAIAHDEVEPAAEFLSQGLAALVLWWSDHPEVARPTLLGVATRAVAGLGAPPGATSPARS